MHSIALVNASATHIVMASNVYNWQEMARQLGTK
jgi:hypothetical protein